MGKVLQRRSIMVAVLLAVLLPAATAGIRGPGRYLGLVLFDRWDTCILFDGVYLMYIASDAKEALRPYAGRPVAIDARKVYQPKNPGDGLISKYVITEAQPPANPLEAAGLHIHLDALNGKTPRLRLWIENQGSNAITLDTEALGFAVLTHTPPKPRFPFDPSDGDSTAVITRTGMTGGEGGSGFSIGALSRSYKWHSDLKEHLPMRFQLTAHESKTITIDLTLPAGEYQAIAGYANGVLKESPIVSQKVDFDVNASGESELISIY